MKTVTLPLLYFYVLFELNICPPFHLFVDRGLLLEPSRMATYVKYPYLEYPLDRVTWSHYPYSDGDNIELSLPVTKDRIWPCKYHPEFEPVGTPIQRMPILLERRSKECRSDLCAMSIRVSSFIIGNKSILLLIK
jgi:hypothetical protein